jgi:hypothetical protein
MVSNTTKHTLIDHIIVPPCHLGTIMWSIRVWLVICYLPCHLGTIMWSIRVWLGVCYLACFCGKNMLSKRVRTWVTYQVILIQKCGFESRWRKNKTLSVKNLYSNTVEFNVQTFILYRYIMFGRGICEKYQSRYEQFPEPNVEGNLVSRLVFFANTPPKHDISVPYYSRGIEGEKRTHPRFADCETLVTKFVKRYQLCVLLQNRICRFYHSLKRLKQNL